MTRAALAASREHWKPWAASVFAQLQRAALSVQLNIAEGYARKACAPFRAHLDIAYGSAIETAELLRLCRSERLVPEQLADGALAQCAECQALLLGLIRRYRRGAS